MYVPALHNHVYFFKLKKRRYWDGLKVEERRKEEGGEGKKAERKKEQVRRGGKEKDEEMLSSRSVYPHGWLLFCLQPNALHQV